MRERDEFAARIAREDAEDARRPETPEERRRRDIRTYDGFSGPSATPSDTTGTDATMADLTDRSYLEDGVWYDIEHKPYRDQQRAAAPDFRSFVEGLIHDRRGTRAVALPAPGSAVRGEEIVVLHRRGRQE